MGQSAEKWKRETQCGLNVRKNFGDLANEAFKNDFSVEEK